MAGPHKAQEFCETSDGTSGSPCGLSKKVPAAPTPKLEEVGPPSDLSHQIAQKREVSGCQP